MNPTHRPAGAARGNQTRRPSVPVWTYLGRVRHMYYDWSKSAILFLLLALVFMGPSLVPDAGRVLGGYDMRGYYYIMHQVAREALSEGRFPLWSPYIFNGFPLVADPQVGAFYPPAWLALILPISLGISWYTLVHIWLAGMGMYLLVRMMGGRQLPALLAGIIFAYGGLLAGRLWAGHSTVYATDAWTPWLSLGLVWATRQRSWSAAIVAGVPFGMAILAGHLPSFLYVAAIWAAFAFYLVLSEKATIGRVSRQAAVMAITGVLLAAIQLLPFLQFSVSSSRVATADYTFATEYSLPPAHLITLAVPQFFGEPTEVGYWSVPTFEELTYYAGVLVFLGIALALARPTRLSWFYLGLMGLGLWLALGRYGVLYKLFYDWLPPFRLVQAPARAAFLYQFAAAGLLGHVMSEWRAVPASQRSESLDRVIRWVASLWAVAGVAALAATGAVFMAVHPTDTSGRLWQQVGGYAQAVILFLLGAGLVKGYLDSRAENRRRRRLLSAGLVILVTLDLWLFSQKFVRLETVPPDTFWVDAASVVGRLQAEEPEISPMQRVLPWGVSVFVQNQAIQVRLPSMFGYDSLSPGAHLALVRSVPDPRSSAYDLLATSYVLATSPLDQFTGVPNGLELAGQQGEAWVYRRPAAVPAARLVYQAEAIADSQAAIDRIHQADFVAADSAILAEPSPCAVGPRPEQMGTARIAEASDGFWRIETNSTAPALLILAESAYPGWQVTVDGQPAETLTAYTTVRAVCVPAGEHVVTWSFRPRILWLGAGLTGAGLLLVVAAWWAGPSRESRRPNRGNQPAA